MIFIDKAVLISGYGGLVGEPWSISSGFGAWRLVLLAITRGLALAGNSGRWCRVSLWLTPPLVPHGEPRNEKARN